MSTDIAVRDNEDADLIEKMVVKGDLSSLTPQDRVRYYYAMCQRAGLDPLAQPLQYLTLSGKLVLYFKRQATDQIASNRKLSRRVVRAEMVNNVYMVVAECSDASGRVEQSTGAVSVQGLAGEALCNAFLKAESKAKRRAVLSFTGLGFLDESEADSIPGATRLDITAAHGAITTTDTETGEVTEALMTREQLAQIGNYTKILRDKFGATDLPQSTGHYKGYTVAQADGAIAMLVGMLAEHQAEFEATAAARKAGAIVAQNTLEELAASFPEIPAHVGTP